jgi:DNA-binding transcriptional regulator of glucitol operon
LGFHLVLIIVVPSCLAMGWWQLNRALSGNELSWLYTFEWPFFAGYACYIWYKVIQSRLKVLNDSMAKKTTMLNENVERQLSVDDSDDPELQEYNRYLQWLHKADSK